MMNTVQTETSFGGIAITRSGTEKKDKQSRTGNTSTIRFMQTKQTKVKKKKLNYNKREVSSQVLRATKLSSASRALATARTKVSTLRRCLGTGQYDDNEVRVAITHAERIVKTAKQKLSNLKEEQIHSKHASRENQTNELKRQTKKRRISTEKQQVKQELAAEQTRAEQRAKEEELRCRQMKRRHRGEELAQVTEADLKYLKDMERLRRYGGTDGRQDTSAATLEIGDSAMRLSELQRTEQALKYEEQQMNAEAAAISAGMETGSVDFSGSGGSGAADTAGAVSADAAAGGSVDVSV